MHSTAGRDGRRLTGYTDNSQQQVSRGHLQHHSLYDDDMDDQHHYYDDDDDEDEEHDDEDSAASVLSIPDPNIDFDLVYALHTFAATVDGQASVVKGDALTLLDDSNSYWWLVKVLKTSEVGYIPAENIETPYERLARLNSHRNIELTRRDIQDAFPTPPSAKSKTTKRVTMAKGVKFQAQVIFGDSDDEEGDFEKEYEEWDEALLSSDSDDMSSDSDDYEYYSSHLAGNGNPDQFQNGFMQHQQHQQQQFNSNKPTPIVTQSLDRRPSQQSAESPLSANSILSPNQYNNNNGRLPGGPFRDTLDLEQSETIKISLTPSIARGGGESSNNHNNGNGNNGNAAGRLERILGDDDSITSPTSPRSGGKKSGFRNFFSRKNSKDSGKRKEGKTSSVSSISAGSYENNGSTSSLSTSYSERNRSGSLDSTMLLSAYTSTPVGNNQQQQQYQQQQNNMNHNNNNNVNKNQNQSYNNNDPSNNLLNSPTSPTAYYTSDHHFNSISDNHDQQQQQQHHHHHHHHEQQQDEHQHEHHHHHHYHHHHEEGETQHELPTTLEIHPSNALIGNKPQTALAYASTTSIELIEQVIEKFGVEDQDVLTDLSMNYYLTVKGVDGDEYTLVPNDQPLTIYHSLTGYLNTPMPSLKKARRISQLMSTTGGSAHIGGPSTSSTDDVSNSIGVRFYLHNKKRQTHHEEGMIRIKVSLLRSEMMDHEELFIHGQSRVDKSLSVPVTGSIGDVTALILERFHILNGIVDGTPDVDEKVKSLRLDGGSQQIAIYRLNIFQHGKERTLLVNDPITKAFEGDTLPPIHFSRGSNPDRSSIASMSSVIHSPQPDETFFILRNVHRQYIPSTNSNTNISSSLPQPPERPARSHRPPVRQNTPMPNINSIEKKSDPLPPVHPLEALSNGGGNEFIDEPEEMDDYENNHSISRKSVSPTQQQQQQQERRSPESYHTASNINYYTDIREKTSVTETNKDVIAKLDETIDNLMQSRAINNNNNNNEQLTENVPQHQQLSMLKSSSNSITNNNNNDNINNRGVSPSSISSAEQALMHSQVTDDFPSTASTDATSVSSEHFQQQQQQQQQHNHNQQQQQQITPSPSPSRGRNASIQSTIYWDDFGMDELMTMIRGTTKCQEAFEKKELERKNKRASRHANAPIRNEIAEVFKDCHLQLEQLEKELDSIMAQSVKTYC